MTVHLHKISTVRIKVADRMIGFSYGYWRIFCMAIFIQYEI